MNKGYFYIFLLCIVYIFITVFLKRNKGVDDVKESFVNTRFTSEELMYNPVSNSTIDRITKMSMYIPNYIRDYCTNSE